jgi:hypothetical protein
MEMSTVDKIIRSLIFDAEVGLQLGQPNDTAVFPPPELNTLRLDNVGSEERLQSPVQE